MPSARPRRLFLVILSIPIFFLFLLFLGSRPTFSDPFSIAAQPPNGKLPEIFGLLHFVTSPDEAGRVISGVGDPNYDNHDDAGPGNVALENENGVFGVQLGGAVAPEHPLSMAWYALGSIAKAGAFRPRGRGASSLENDGWDERLETLRERYPLVVFSKTYCPYSKRAKKLLETYDLAPPPKIIEVDLRADASHIKTLLTRLTHQSTFPNVILHGHSLGGSDDLIRLHEEGQLRQILEKGGIKAGRMGEGGALL